MTGSVGELCSLVRIITPFITFWISPNELH